MNFLLIGAGIGQLNLAKKIKKRGHKLLVFAYNSIPEVTSIADKFVHLDLHDYTNVLAHAKAEHVDAVVSDQHDIFAPLVAFIAENLHLPGNNLDILNSYCNKNKFRDNCDKLKIPVPKHIEVSSTSIPEVFLSTPFPWMVKPADSQSSVGVRKVNSVKECLLAIKEAIEQSRSRTAIIEEFFEGIEFVVEGFIWEGKYYNLGFADRKYFGIKEVFIPSQTIFPSAIDTTILKEAVSYEECMADYIKPKFAIVHSEYLYNSKTQKICVVESALRGGGVYISSHLIPLYTNIDINDVLLDAAEGKYIDMPEILKNKEERSAAYVCFYLPEGEIESVYGTDRVLSDESVSFADFSKIKIGNKIQKMEHKGQRLGPIIISENNRELLENRIKIIQKELSVKMKNQNIVNAIKWD